MWSSFTWCSFRGVIVSITVKLHLPRNGCSKDCYTQRTWVWQNRFDDDDAEMATNILHSYMSWTTQANKFYTLCHSWPRFEYKSIAPIFPKNVLFISMKLPKPVLKNRVFYILPKKSRCFIPLQHITWSIYSLYLQ